MPTEDIIEDEKLTQKIGEVELKTMSLIGGMSLLGVAAYTIYEIMHYHDHRD